jgi:TnpA family transposase
MVKANWDTEELIETWTLLPQELELVSSKVGANQIGFAVLLKYFQIYARFPSSAKEIPDTIISYIAQQLQIPSNYYLDYDWQGRSISNHRASIRKLFGFRTATLADGEEMINWLKAEIIPNEQRIEPITELVYQRWREIQIEPPTEGRIERLIRSAIAQHETNFCQQILDKLTPEIAEVAIAEPSGVIEQVIFPVVSRQTLKDLVAEYKATGTVYRRRVHNVMRASFAGHYRRMIPQLLEVLEFRSNNDLHRPVIEALELLRKYASSKARYYDSSEEIAIDGVLKSNAKDLLLETDSEGNERINRINYEICVLKALRERLCCKEIWVVGANRYRNPDEDLPTDFESKRQVYYQVLTLPEDVETFISGLQQQMVSGLEKLDRGMPKNKGVTILGKGHKGLIRLSPFEAAPEPFNIKQLKGEINRLWHKTSLLDILKETDLRVDFTRNFKSMGTREILDRETLQKRLLLCLFGMGTNTGLKRINTGVDGENYQDLVYVRRRYIHKDQLRSAIAEVVNAIFKIRLPHIWGEGTTTCASDSKHFGAWEQNLITQYHLRYGGRGVMIYWHVEKNSTCIYSQLKTCSSSEVAAMINGVLKHCTSMEVQKNYVDSHGQSEVAFAFTHLLGFQLMPRLKRIKVQKLYRPHAGVADTYSNLQPILTRPINWDLIRQQYDQMVKYATALRLGTAETEAILKRFSKNPFKHPTYLALMELGRVIKTIFLCQYLEEEAIRREINEGLNVVERWNGVNDFIFYGKGGEFASNRLESQELSVLSLHLLQICLVYVNTLMIQSVLEQKHWEKRLTATDLRAITPLIFSHVNPYGLFKLDMKERISRLSPPLVA